MTMYALYLYFIFTQLPVTAPPATDIVEHDGTANMVPLMPKDMQVSYPQMRRWTSEQVAAELVRKNEQSAGNRAVQMATMYWMVRAVANADITDPVLKDRTSGRFDPRFRALCHPYVDAIVLPELSIPANPELLNGQWKMVSLFEDNSEETDRAKVRERPASRKEYVRRLCLVWSRVIRTCLVYREIYSEDVMTGEAEWKRPDQPDVVGEYGPRVDPKYIRDPLKRKAYEDYLAADQWERDRYSAATNTYRLRKDVLKHIRDEFVRMYGEDRTKWDELRQIVTDTVKDPDIAKLVLKDFTQRKEPGVWPVGPKPEAEPAPKMDTP
jgi:hypothetical protein